MTLVDVLMAISVLVVAVALSSMAITSSARYAEGARETVVAYEAAESILAELDSRNFIDVFADFNELTIDDGADSPGADFDVPGLDARPDDVDGLPGKISFPVDDGAPGVLREDLSDPRFPSPLDLDLDGAIDAVDKAATYRILPVRVEVEWRGQQGTSRVVVEGMLSQW
ncbi:MAG: hypothetical protein AAGG01_07740 [Planctomycetota bacterium]